MTETGAPDAQTTRLHLALLGGCRQDGSWQMRRRTIAISAVGGIDLDLTGASLPGGDVTVVKVSFVGGAKLKVPAGINVVVEGFNLIGPRSRGTGPVVPGAPTVRLFAYGIWGGVRIERG